MLQKTRRANLKVRKKTFTDYVVKDLKLAEFGRKEIELAEHEMPGLMAMRGVWKVKTIERCSHSRLPSYDYTDGSPH